jgi:FkbM family methyltransferase
MTRIKGAVRRLGSSGVAHPAQLGVGLFDISELRHGDRSQLEDRIRGAARYAALDRDVGLARVLGRYKMFVNPKDDAVSAHLILDGFWEMWNTVFISRFIKPGMKIIEIGSNLGYFSLLMSDLVGPNGRVVGFEPLTYNAELLERTIAINGFHSRFQADRRAVSDRDGFGHIYVPVGNWGGGSIMVGAHSFENATHEEVETIRLDAFCEANEFWPEFIRMDAEGSELAIWNGMSQLRQKQRKLAVMMEFDHNRVPGWRRWFEEMEAESFRLYRVGYDSKLARLRAGDSDPTDMFEVLALRGYSDDVA